MAVTAQPQIEAARAALAGGIWSLLLYSMCVVLHIGFSYPYGIRLLGLWDALLPGDAHTNQGMAMGFPLAFLYGGVAVWVFASLYNIAGPATRGGGEGS